MGFECARSFIRSGSQLVGMVLAGGLSLYLHGVFAPDFGFADTVLLLVIPMPFAIIALFFIPETAGRTLEDITAK